MLAKYIFLLIFYVFSIAYGLDTNEIDSNSNTIITQVTTDDQCLTLCKSVSNCDTFEFKKGLCFLKTTASTNPLEKLLIRSKRKGFRSGSRGFSAARSSSHSWSSGSSNSGTKSSGSSSSIWLIPSSGSGSSGSSGIGSYILYTIIIIVSICCCCCCCCGFCCNDDKKDESVTTTTTEVNKENRHIIVPLVAK